MAPRNWQGLARKLADGMDVTSAAVALGIPVSEAREYQEAARRQAVANDADLAAIDVLMAELFNADAEVRIKAAGKLLTWSRHERARFQKYMEGQKDADGKKSGDVWGPWKGLTLPSEQEGIQ